MVGGFNAVEQPAPSDSTHIVIPDTGTPIESDPKKSLQLEILKFKDQDCSQNVTADLLLDRSSSMGKLTPSGEIKIERLKEAVTNLVNKLSDTSIIGIQSFSSVSITPDVPISYYKDVKSIIPQILNDMQPDGSTPTHDALAFSYTKLQEALSNFPGRHFNFIFISDGAPCPGIGCLGSTGINQDPRLFNPNPADQIKALGVNVYTLAIYESGQADKPALADLMKSIASSPQNYYEAKSADETTALLNTISERICQ